jgi:cold-inducible RNA-binding protein
LSFDTTQDSVQKLFEQFGTVTDCFMPMDRDSGKVRGFCFVTMPANVAEEACNKANGYELDGRALRVNEAQPKGSSGGDGGGRGGGRGGGEEEEVIVEVDMVAVVTMPALVDMVEVDTV